MPTTRLYTAVRRVSDRLAGDPLAARLVYLIGFCAAVGIAPLALARLLSHDYEMAVVDTLVLVGVLMPAIYCWVTRQVHLASITMSVVAVVGALTITVLRGVESVYWLFPAVISPFFILPPRIALGLGLLTNIAVIPLAGPRLETIALGNLLVPLALIAVFGYIFSIQAQLRQGRLDELASRDALTGLRNRRALDRMFAEGQMPHEPCDDSPALLIMDLDHFKRVNDCHGHVAGDRLLQRCAELLRRNLRASDRIFRYGGEEFVVLLRYSRPSETARVAESLRQAIHKGLSGDCGAITASIGFAQRNAAESWQDSLKRADAALYRAKAEGRDCVRAA